MDTAILKVTSLHKSYLMGATPLQVLKGVNLSVRAGEFLAVMGSSGCGKSTLLHLLGALDTPDDGTVEFEGRDLYARSERERDQIRCHRIGFVFQFYHLLPELTVFENILLPRMVAASTGQWPGSRGKSVREVEEIMGQVGLLDRRNHRPEQLSGGERQRAAIARAVANRPRLLLADEPTGNLDSESGKRIMAVLSALNEQGQTIVMVTHDPNNAALAHRRVHLTDGRIASPLPSRDRESIVATGG